MKHKEETKFTLCCPTDWGGYGCGKDHVVMEGSGFKTLCGRELTPRRFDSGMDSGDISSQEKMTDLSDRGCLSHCVCQKCMKSLIKLGKTYNVEVKPITWVL